MDPSVVSVVKAIWAGSYELLLRKLYLRIILRTFSYKSGNATLWILHRAGQNVAPGSSLNIFRTFPRTLIAEAVFILV
ncbi:hypothetical protein VTL71DRAFT_13965 [Oculimacula yallundae]|uniref:Uncharacterized protein n=1 Tax=Oculimacula yallundae TaxID=86028 RepID=A0ABR4CPF0_9HELO